MTFGFEYSVLMLFYKRFLLMIDEKGKGLYQCESREGNIKTCRMFYNDVYRYRMWESHAYTPIQSEDKAWLSGTTTTTINLFP